MSDNEELIDKYLEKPYWVIDFLPKQVPENSRGQYFSIENYYLGEPQYGLLLQKFVHILTKLNCYEDFLVFHSSGEWVNNPAPQTLEKWVKGRKPLFVLMESQDTLLAINGDDLYITLYNPNEEVLQLVSPMAASEGLFLWKPTSQK